MRRSSLISVALVSLDLMAVASACGGGGDGGNGPPPPPPPVETVTVTPGADTVIIKATRQLAVVLKDSAGTVLTGRTIAWTVSDPALASVSGTGLVTATAPGVVKVAATSEQKSDTATLTLAPLLTLGPRLPSLFAGDTVHLSAALKDALGGIVAGNVTWISRQPGKATVSAGVVTGVDSGRVTIVASGLAVAESVVVAVLVPRVGVNREIAYLHDTTRADGQSILELRTVLPGASVSQRVSGLDEYTNEYAWSPDGSRVVVSYLNLNGLGKAGLYVINADGGGEMQVAPAGSHPRWSPDGTRIAYRSATGPARIHVAMADGGGSVPLTTGGPDDLDPEWSPDGRQIAFRRQSTFCEQMWIMDADGSHQRQILVPISPCNFVWSPDGKDIAISGGGGAGVWAIRPDATGFRALSPNCDATGACNGVGAFSEPDWSPDGGRLLLSSGNGEVLVISRAAQPIDTLTVPAASFGLSTSAAWSPDGQKVAYVAGHLHVPTGTMQPTVGTMDADGSNQILITDFHLFSESPQWRP